jgi:hypothetical protein
MHSDIGYLRGLISETGTIAVLAASEKLEDQDIDHVFIAIQKDDKWVIRQEEFSAVSMHCGKGNFARTVAILGMEGDVVVNNPNGVVHERLGKGKSAPNKLRTMHEVRAIGSSFYAVGMRRQVFRRNMSAGPWEKIDSGVFVPDSSKEVAGFLSIDGFGDDEIYAVGYGGQIWMFDGKTWSQVVSPTNARLECVRCTLEGDVLASGEGGVILRGRKSTWRVLDQDITEEPFTGIAVLKKTAYFATEDGTIVALGNDKFSQVIPKEGSEVTTGFLDSNGKELLSIGEADILLFNGRAWRELPHPPISAS